MERISVIVPVYNGEKYLERCLESIRKQTYQELQILVIDDGSTDQTLFISREYEKKDSRIRVIHQENQGVSAARNRGIQEAQGEYLLFVDADDFIAENMAYSLYNHIKKAPDIDVAICNYAQGQKQIDEKKEIEILNQEEAMTRLFYRNSYQGFLWNKMFKAEIVKNNRITLDVGIPICEDLLFCSQYFALIKNAVYDHQVYYYYEDTGEGATRSDRFNSKRYSMLDAYDRIERVLVQKRVKAAAQNYLSTICMLLLKMTLKYKEETRNEYLQRLLTYMPKTSWKYLISPWQIKFKIAYVPFKIASYFRKRK